MTFRIFLFLLTIPFFLPAQAVRKDTIRLKITRSHKVYQAACAANPDNRLVEIKKAIPGIVLDIKIFDAYRPYTVTVAFYQKASNKTFVASPKKGSRHNRGCAVDLTLIDLKTGREIPMPTGYDSFAPQASPAFKDLPENIIKNRDFLIATMERNGFRVISNEWWHYDFTGWKNYALMDIPFEDL